MEVFVTEMGLGLELGVFGVLTVDIRPQGVRNIMFVVLGLFCQVFSPSVKDHFSLLTSSDYQLN